MSDDERRGMSRVDELLRRYSDAESGAVETTSKLGGLIPPPEDYYDRVNRRPYDETAYECGVCLDARVVVRRDETHSTVTMPCPSCAAGAALDVIIAKMGGDPTKTLDSFDLTVNANMRGAIDAVMAVVNGDRWVAWLRGSPGCGKTHVANAGLIEWVKTSNNVDARFVRVADLMDEFRACYDRDSTYAVDELVKVYARKAFLVLDDLGAERRKDFTDEIMFRVVDGRLRQRRATVVTSNIEPNTEEDREKFHERLASRLSVGEVVIEGVADVRARFDI